MPLLSITDAEAVRLEGALLVPEESNGAATDRQIQTAIRSARRTMVEKIGEPLYTQVQGYSDTDLEIESKDDQYNAFLHAEASFAIAHLARKLSGVQLAATGLIQSVEIGKARSSFASSEEADKIGKVWEAEGNRWLSPYFAVPIDAITQQPTSFTSRKGTFYVGVLDQPSNIP